MALETATFIDGLVSTNPTASDPKAQGDDHIRLLKSTIRATFPNVTGAVTPTHTELNYVDGVTSAIQTQLDSKAPLVSPALTGTPTAPTAVAGTNTTQLATTAYVIGERSATATLTNKTLTAPVINSPTGLVKSDVGLGNVDNTSDLNKPVSTATQTALNLKADLASPAFTGIPTAPTATAGTNTDQLATCAFVTNQVLTATLPGQGGNAGRYLTTNGTSASWGDPLPSQTGNSGSYLTTNGSNASWATLPASGDASTNTSTSVDSEIAIFSGTGGKTLKRATGTGMLKMTSGVLQTAVSGSDFVTPNGIETLTNKTIEFANNTLTGVQPTLVSGTNIKTINGSSMLGSGDLAVGGGSLILLATVTANNSATVDLETGVGPTYDDYMVIAENVSPSSSQFAMFRIKAGGSYLSSSIYGIVRSGADASGPRGSASNETAIIMSLSATATGDQSYVAYFMNCNSTSNKNAIITGGNSVQLVTASASISTSGAAQGFRFMYAAGNVVTGTFRLYGIKKN